MSEETCYSTLLLPKLCFDSKNIILSLIFRINTVILVLAEQLRHFIKVFNLYVVFCTNTADVSRWPICSKC